MIRTLLIASTWLAVAGVHAQCSTCSIDPTCMAVPAYPTLCPQQPVAAVAGEAYESDITFWLPPSFTDPGTGIEVDFLQMTITSIAGLPFGLELTTNDPLGIYHPQQNPYGCARLCGTPIGSGTYTVEINIIAMVQASGFTLNVPQTFGITLVVLPGSGANALFSFTPSTGCGSVDVQFSASITGGGSPVTYAWDLGNGSSSDLASPQASFSGAGDHPVSLVTTIGGYVLTDVVLSGVSDNWCGDVEEPSLFGACTGNPDLYFVLTDGNGNSFTSNSGDNSSSQTWNGVDRVLATPPYSIAFFDEDPISQDDDLGTFNIPTGSNGVLPFALGNGTYGSLNIAILPQEVYTASDTVRVFPVPQPTTAYDSSTSTLCATDTMELTYLWLHDGDTVAGASGPCVTLNGTGAWWAIATNAFGCTASSDTVVICPTVTIQANGPVLYVQADFESYQWSLNGVPIPGADAPFHVATTGGTYHITVTTESGCEVGDDYGLIITGMDASGPSGSLTAYPNPNRGRFRLEIPGDLPPLTRIEILDPVGRICYRGQWSTGTRQDVELSSPVAGRYLVLVGDRYITTVIID